MRKSSIFFALIGSLIGLIWPLFLCVEVYRNQQQGHGSPEDGIPFTLAFFALIFSSLGIFGGLITFRNPHRSGALQLVAGIGGFLSFVLLGAAPIWLLSLLLLCTGGVLALRSTDSALQ